MSWVIETSGELRLPHLPSLKKKGKKQAAKRQGSKNDSRLWEEEKGGGISGIKFSRKECKIAFGL